MESIKGLINLSEDFLSLSLAFILFILEENKDSVYFSFSNYFMYMCLCTYVYQNEIGGARKGGERNHLAHLLSTFVYSHYTENG